MPAGKLHKAVAMRLRPKRKTCRSDDLIGLDRRRHIGDREGAEWNLTAAAWPLHHHGGVEGGRHRDKLGGWIEMAERAAERAAVAGLAMADIEDCRMHQRTALANEIG